MPAPQSWPRAANQIHHGTPGRISRHRRLRLRVGRAAGGPTAASREQQTGAGRVPAGRAAARTRGAGDHRGAEPVAQQTRLPRTSASRTSASRTSPGAPAGRATVATDTAPAGAAHSSGVPAVPAADEGRRARRVRARPGVRRLARGQQGVQDLRGDVRPLSASSRSRRESRPPRLTTPASLPPPHCARLTVPVSAAPAARWRPALLRRNRRRPGHPPCPGPGAGGCGPRRGAGA